ncbi:uncharacterized protein [Montipora foliosa]|uniref:uncharacterized protein isoform X1 n=2 Tax=Montipora foliosa TaxID=591990 RepID=UPI0035F1B65D
MCVIDARIENNLGTGMVTTFGVEAETIVLLASSGFLSFLFLFWIITLAVILWLRKINLHVEKAVEIVNSPKRDNLEHKNKAFAYGCAKTDSYEDETDLRKASFKDKCKILMKPINGLGEKVLSSSDQFKAETFSENNERKVYCSIKDPTKIRCVAYRKADPGKTFLLTDSTEVIDGKHDATCEADITYENDYLVLIDETSDQSAVPCSGSHFKESENQNTDEYTEITDSQPEYVNGYLEIIHSDKVQRKGTDLKFLDNNNTHDSIEIYDSQPKYENGFLEMTPSDKTHDLLASVEDERLPRQDDFGYLIPIETLPTEKQDEEEGYDVPMERGRKQNEQYECVDLNKTA